MKHNRGIYALIIFAIIAIAGGVILSFGKVPTGNEPDNSQNSGQAGDLPTDQSTGTNQDSYVHNQDLSGGKLGDYYLINSFEFQPQPDFDQVVFDFSSDTGKTIPRYTVRQDDSVLSLTFSDTRDFNLNTGQSAFTGEKSVTVSGLVIRSVTLNHLQDDSTIGIDIECKGAEFGYRVSEDALKLTLYVK